MIKTVVRLRFNAPEPTQLRGNALAGIMNQGDEGNTITFDDATGLVSFVKPGRTRVLHVSACAWIEFANDIKAPEAPKK